MPETGRKVGKGKRFGDREKKGTTGSRGLPGEVR